MPPSPQESIGDWPRRGNVAGFALAAACALGAAREFVKATDFPVDAPVARVDRALVERLRAQPGLHVALAPDARIEVPLDLREDASNRTIFGTEVDLREPVPRRAIHIQRKAGRGAIHADDWNPAAGPLHRIVHGTLDVPALPLLFGLGLGVGLAVRRRGRDAG